MGARGQRTRLQPRPRPTKVSLLGSPQAATSWAAARPSRERQTVGLQGPGEGPGPPWTPGASRWPASAGSGSQWRWPQASPQARLPAAQGQHRQTQLLSVHPGAQPSAVCILFEIKIKAKPRSHLRSTAGLRWSRRKAGASSPLPEPESAAHPAAQPEPRPGQPVRTGQWQGLWPEPHPGARGASCSVAPNTHLPEPRPHHME